MEENGIDRKKVWQDLITGDSLQDSIDECIDVRMATTLVFRGREKKLGTCLRTCFCT